MKWNSPFLLTFATMAYCPIWFIWEKWPKPRSAFPAYSLKEKDARFQAVTNIVAFMAIKYHIS